MKLFPRWTLFFHTYVIVQKSDKAISQNISKFQHLPKNLCMLTKIINYQNVNIYFFFSVESIFAFLLTIYLPLCGTQKLKEKMRILLTLWYEKYQAYFVLSSSWFSTLQKMNFIFKHHLFVFLCGCGGDENVGGVVVGFSFYDEGVGFVPFHYRGRTDNSKWQMALQA